MTRTFKRRLASALTGALLALAVSSCASNGFLMAKAKVTMFRQAGPPKPADAQVEVFQTNKPERQYDELARIECDDTDDSWAMKQILESARKIGADAVIILGRVGSLGVATGTATAVGPVATGSGVSLGQGYGFSAVAVRYK